MPAEKTHRRQQRLAVYSKSVRTASRSRVTGARAAIAADAKSPETAATVKEAMRALDRAASKGVIHPNNAARRKSRLALRLNKAAAS
jgi:small subunit ribosomal protein S20